jgi:hypothetical protein
VDHPFVSRAAVLVGEILRVTRSEAYSVARHLCVAIHGLVGALHQSRPDPTVLERYVADVVGGLVRGQAARRELAM